MGGCGARVDGGEWCKCVSVCVCVCVRGDGSGSNHSDRALTVLDLGLEPLQVRDAAADVRNVLPAAAELHDED